MALGYFEGDTEGDLFGGQHTPFTSDPSWPMNGDVSFENIPMNRSTDPWDVGYVGGSNSYTAANSGYQNSGQFNPGEGYQDYDNPSWYDKNSTGQLGIDNAFRLGGIGLAGLGMASNLKTINEGRQAREGALSFLDQNRDPNAAFYREELGRMLRSNSGYLTDVNTQNKVKLARDTMARQNALQGRGELSAEQLRSLQDVSAKHYNERIQTLSQLLGKDDAIVRARAEMMSRAPQGNTLGAVLPGLSNIFNTANEYAISQGYASEPRTRVAPRFRGLPPQVQQQFPDLVGN